MRSVSLVTAIIFATAWAGTDAMAQCTCLPYLSLREQFERADAVFIGKMIEARDLVDENSLSKVTLVKVEVLQTWKQDLERFVTIKYEHKPQFSFSFEPNFESLLYAYKNEDGTFNAWDCCLATKPLTHAADDLKQFKNWGEKPKKVIEPKSPPNKSLDASGEGVFHIMSGPAHSVGSVCLTFSEGAGD